MKCNARMILAAMMAAGVSFALWGDTFTAVSYKQEGLIGQWDGIENAGAGVHDDNATYWKDLTEQSGDFALFAGVASFTSNGLHKDAQGIMATNVTAAARTGVRTIEVVVSGVPNSGWVNTFFISHNQTITLNNSAKDGKRGYFFDNNRKGFLTDRKVAQETVAVIYNGNSDTANYYYRDGAVPDGESYINNWSAAKGTSTMHIGGRTGFLSSNDAQTFGYTVHAIRIYDHALTRTEISLHASIDQIRFFGAPEESISFANNKTNFVVTAVADVGGFVVGADSVPATTARSAWMYYEGSGATVTPVAMRAIPMPGWKFSGWVGELAYAEGDSASSRVLVVDLSCCRMYRATFEREAESVGCNYVTNGLVGLWDGIENAGAGLYDTNSTRWVDLSGHGGDFIVNGAVASFDGTGLKKKATGVCATNLIAYTGVRTIEGVVSGTPASGWVNAICLNQNQTLTYANSDSNERRYFFDYAKSTWRLAGLAAEVPMSVTYTTVNNVVQGQDFYLDGVLQTDGRISNSGMYWSGASPAGTSIGGRIGFPNGGDANTSGYTVHALRLYNRVLSAGEVAYNRAVDRRRFHGVRTEVFAYRLVDDAVQCQLRAWTGGIGGTVKVNDGAAADCAATAWVAYGTEQTATFTATPAQGWKFAGWTGDVDAIVSGSANDLSVGVSSTGGVALQALFTQTKKYVQDGLIGFWDARENAGFGQFDAESTVWTDLTGITGDFTVNAYSGVFEQDSLHKVRRGHVAFMNSRRTDIRTIEAVVSDVPADANVWTMPVYVSEKQHITLKDQGEGKNRLYFFDYNHYGLTTAERPQQMTIALLCESKDAAEKVYINSAEPAGDAYTAYWNDLFGGKKIMTMGGRLNKSDYADYKAVGFRIHAIRFYNRKLEPAEIAKNARVDGVRYFGNPESGIVILVR